MSYLESLTAAFNGAAADPPTLSLEQARQALAESRDVDERGRSLAAVAVALAWESLTPNDLPVSTPAVATPNVGSQQRTRWVWHGRPDRSARREASRRCRRWAATSWRPTSALFSEPSLPAVGRRLGCSVEATMTLLVFRMEPDPGCVGLPGRRADPDRPTSVDPFEACREVLHQLGTRELPPHRRRG